MKIANIDREILHNFWNNLRNFNEIFRKDVPYDNFKSHKKPGFHPIFRRYNFQKSQGGQIDHRPPPHPTPLAVLRLNYNVGKTALLQTPVFHISKKWLFCTFIKQSLFHEFSSIFKKHEMQKKNFSVWPDRNKFKFLQSFFSTLVH